MQLLIIPEFDISAYSADEGGVFREGPICLPVKKTIIGYTPTLRMKRNIIVSLFLLWCAFAAAQVTEWSPDDRVIRSGRDDGRYLSSYGVVHSMLSNIKPECAFRTDMSRKEFGKWQKKVRKSMQEIMNFPKQPDNSPVPKRIHTVQRDGYRLEKWEYYPLPDCVSTFLVLIPDSLTKPLPAILCIPGSGGFKEELAGEPGVTANLDDDYRNPKVTMARNFAKAGYIAVAVDNPAAGEAADLGQYGRGRNYNYDLVSRFLLEMGWSYLGYTAYLDMQVLEWMKSQSYIRRERIVISGFSLGTEPLMVLGVLDPSIYAFVYNDFLCQTQERALVMTVPDKNGTRTFPNSIRHLVPNFWHKFNFPDIVASLAPRPVILTEGGLDRDFDTIRRAYEISGYPSNVEMYHYPKFADPQMRKKIDKLPEGLSRDEFFDMVNVDAPGHYFKSELVIPWLKKHLE